jgi:flagellar FliJ protein
MRRSQRLQPVVKLAERKEQQALNALAELQKQIQDEEKKVEELSQYRMEYQKGLNASGSINVAQLQSHQTFMAQLDNIISTQKDRRQQLDQEVKRLTDHYLLLHLKT